VSAGEAGSDHAARAELRHPFRILVGHRVRFRRSIVSRSALKYDGLCAVTPGPSRIAALSHFGLIKTVLRPARAQRYLAQSLSDAGREIFAQGAAMISTPIGSFSCSVHTGIATTGMPMKDIG
jgi:hypothetical protein